MKKRSGFVSNSSSSSFICDLCGRQESGWDAGLSDFEMVECENGHTLCEDELLADWKTDGEEDEDGEDRYSVKEICCPICQFQVSSKPDLHSYFRKRYPDITEESVFAEIKKVNPRRKKLYDNEYVNAVYLNKNLQEAIILQELKSEFGTYSKFKEYLRK